MNNISEIGKWQRRKAARPSEIVDAALALFSEKGFAATRIDEVAKRAGVSKGTVYLYFDSKEQLLKAVVKEKLLPQMEKAENLVIEYQGSYAGLLEKLAKHWWSSLQEAKLTKLPKLIISEASNFPDIANFFIENVVQRVRGVFTKIIEQGIISGEFRETSAIEAARVFTSAIVFAAIWQHSMAPFDSIPFDADIYLQLHIENFIRGLRKL